MELSSVGKFDIVLRPADGIGQDLLHVLSNNSGLRCVFQSILLLLGQLVRELLSVFVLHNLDFVDIVQLLLGIQLSDFLLDSEIARLKQLSGQLDVALNGESLTGLISVDANLSCK